MHARATDRGAFLDHDHARVRLRRLHGSLLPGRTAADHDEVEALFDHLFGHAIAFTVIAMSGARFAIAARSSG